MNWSILIEKSKVNIKERLGGVSLLKNRISRLKMLTRTGLVAKKWSFSAQNVDENGSRRQKMEFLGSKCWRERVSSSKNGVSRLKMVTRTGLVAKKWHFSAQTGDENGSRRQKMEFLGSKRWREWVSSSKTGIFLLKTLARTSLVAKKWSFSAQNVDENGSRR